MTIHWSSVAVAVGVVAVAYVLAHHVLHII
jgi:hypothetical protein